MKQLQVTYRAGKNEESANEGGFKIFVIDEVAEKLLHPDSSWECVTLQARLNTVARNMAVMQTGIDFINAEVIDIREVTENA